MTFRNSFINSNKLVEKLHFGGEGQIACMGRDIVVDIYMFKIMRHRSNMRKDRLELWM